MGNTGILTHPGLRGSWVEFFPVDKRNAVMRVDVSGRKPLSACVYVPAQKVPPTGSVVVMLGMLERHKWEECPPGSGIVRHTVVRYAGSVQATPNT